MSPDKAIIRLTKAQRQKLFDCGVGVGVVAYKSATNQLTESDFYLDSKGQMRFTGNGAPVVFEVNHDDEGWAENAKIVEFDAEMQARADILNRAVRHKEALFPNEIGNGWIDSIDRTAHEVATLRGQLAAKERELEVARLAHKATDKDRQQALDLLDAAGVWTGADLLVHDRVASLIRDWQEQQRKIVALQAEVGHLQAESRNSMLAEAQQQAKDDDAIAQRIETQLSTAGFPSIEDVYVSTNYSAYVTFEREPSNKHIKFAQNAFGLEIVRSDPRLRNRYRVTFKSPDREEA